MYVRWVGEWGGQPHSGHSTDVTVTVNHKDGSDETTLDQVPPSDGWHLIGTYEFTRGSSAIPAVTIESSQPGKSVLTDGVRLLRVR